MRCDIVSIFPEYLEPLSLSLPGQAQRKGLLEVVVHDLRDFAHDRHRTVDDTPYGGGAGMVMKPQPWWEALDHVRGLQSGTPTLIVPGPGGEVLTQSVARELSQLEWLVFACGRYEGIDERVYEAAAEVMPVRVISLGDYVLNGGEVAVLAMIEAAARLLPGFMGNAESLVEESHEDGLLEYPVYTKPSSWRGRDVPPVLLSGDHGKVAQWRQQQRLERTAARRPDLVHAAAAAHPDELQIRPARPADAGELLTLSRALGWPDAVGTETTWVARAGGRLVGSIDARALDGSAEKWVIDRLQVVPDLQGRAFEARLLAFAEGCAPAAVRKFDVRTMSGDIHVSAALRKAGYRPASSTDAEFHSFRKRR